MWPNRAKCTPVESLAVASSSSVASTFVDICAASTQTKSPFNVPSAQRHSVVETMSINTSRFTAPLVDLLALLYLPVLPRWMVLLVLLEVKALVALLQKTGSGREVAR